MSWRLRPPGLLAGGVACAVLAGVLVAGPAGATSPLQLTLPAPTGSESVGTVSLHLIDPGRQDPWVPGRQRELMVSIWYPARHTEHYPAVPWMPPATAATFEQLNGIPAGSVTMPVTAGHDGAPVDRRRGGLPVVVYSPGSGSDRSINTALVEELASRGYMVVTIDHTYDAEEVEFPGGRIELRNMSPDSRRGATQ